MTRSPKTVSDLEQKASHLEQHVQTTALTNESEDSRPRDLTKQTDETLSWLRNIQSSYESGNGQLLSKPELRTLTTKHNEEQPTDVEIYYDNVLDSIDQFLTAHQTYQEGPFTTEDVPNSAGQPYAKIGFFTGLLGASMLTTGVAVSGPPSAFIPTFAGGSAVGASATLWLERKGWQYGKKKAAERMNEEYYQAGEAMTEAQRQYTTFAPKFLETAQRYITPGENTALEDKVITTIDIVSSSPSGICLEKADYQRIDGHKSSYSLRRTFRQTDKVPLPGSANLVDPNSYQR